MTLILMAVNESGVWQCSDRRVTLIEPTRSGHASERVIDDDSIKHVDLKFPDGNALLAYTGLAYLGNRHLSEWVAETLIGKQLLIKEALETIRDRATSEIGNKTHHDFLIGGFQNRQPWAARITNGAPRPDDWSVPPLSNFEMGGMGITQPMVFCAGAVRSVTSKDIQTIVQAVAANAASEDLRRLPAAVNRRAAQARHPDARYVSEGCVSVSLDPDGVTTSQIFHWMPHPERQPAIPSVSFGADTTTPDTALPGLRRALLEIQFATPEAEAEFERNVTEWENDRLVELNWQRQRLHRPKN